MSHHDTATPDVPFVDLKPQNDQVAEAALGAVAEVVASGAFVLGPAVGRFEDAYAAFSGVEHCVGVGNGTDAIELALRGAGVGPGDEVVVPANTFVATAEAVVRAGAHVVLVDCDDDFLLDVDAVPAVLTGRTRAVVGVDLYGQVAPFERLRRVLDAAGRPDVLLVEDGAQSQGATRHGRPAGSFGAAAATSFYPGKNLGAHGDAGAVTTGDAEVAERIRALRNHGGVRRYEHLVVGTNSRLDSVQAAVLSVKLEQLKGWNADRQRAAALYDELLAGVEGAVRPRVVPGNEHVWHLYVVRVAERDRVLGELAAHGVGAGIHYPTPVHLLPAFAGLGRGPGAFPVAESLAEQIISLPMFPGITPAQQERVAHVLADAVAS
jgi:dTDP-4-amino-4,6-dideoxygalactose transaminase